MTMVAWMHPATGGIFWAHSSSKPRKRSESATSQARPSIRTPLLSSSAKRALASGLDAPEREMRMRKRAPRSTSQRARARPRPPNPPAMRYVASARRARFGSFGVRSCRTV